MSKARRQLLDRPAQVRAAGSPTAHRLLGALERLGPSSVSELSGHLGMPAASLYYHLHRLEGAGVLVKHTRPSPSGRPEAVYAVPADEVEISSRGSRQLAREVARSGRGMLALAGRLYAAAVGKLPRPTARSRRRNVLVQVQGRLSPAALAEVQQRMDALAAYIAEHDDPEGDEFSCFTGALSPVLHESR